ncbi:hypothetical protein HWV62_37609 [Athelia sp. TMB]|nr:hypothetical protein HWV62_37609 [Athelia sp. TMB]
MPEICSLAYDLASKNPSDLFEPASVSAESQRDSASYTDCNGCQVSDSASDISIQEVREQLSLDGSQEGCVGPHINHQISSSSIFGIPACSSLSGQLKRPRISADSEWDQEKLPFKKARFLTPISLAIHDISSAGAAQLCLSTATQPVSFTSYYDRSMFSTSPPGSPNKSSLHLINLSTDAPAQQLANFRREICGNGFEDVDSTQHTSATTEADQSGSTLIDSSSYTNDIDTLFVCFHSSDLILRGCPLTESFHFRPFRFCRSGKDLQQPQTKLSTSIEPNFWNRAVSMHSSPKGTPLSREAVSQALLHHHTKFPSQKGSNMLEKRFVIEVLNSRPKPPNLRPSIQPLPATGPGSLRVSVEDFLDCISPPECISRKITTGGSSARDVCEKWDLEPKVGVTLFEAGKMHLGRKMRCLGHS